MLAEIFRFLFRFSFFRKRFFGIHKRIFKPFNLFRGSIKRISLRDGIRLELKISDWIQENLFFLGEYEEAEIRFVESSLKPGNVFIDIGANIGLYSLVASRLVGESGRVLSFEPLRQNFDSLKNNISINKAENKGFDNIVLENLAVSEKEGELEIFFAENEANLGMASSYLREYSGSVKINSISIDQYLNKNPLEKVDFIKIDIEGGEFQALLGMKNTLIKFNPILLIEINREVLGRTPHNEQDILKFLEDLGYEKHQIDDNPERQNLVFLKPRKIEK